jgi:hypothetical protein
LAVAALNVVVRRESANLVKKQIQSLVRGSRSLLPQSWITLAPA